MTAAQTPAPDAVPPRGGRALSHVIRRAAAAAVGSSVIVTTFTDCCGFMSFLGLGTLLLNHLK